MKRYITIKDDELKDLVLKKGEIVTKGRKHYEKMVRLNDEGNALAADRNEIVSKILAKTGLALKDEEIGEFELATTTDIKDGEVRVEIVDRIAQFKENMREEKERAERKESGEMTPEEEAEENKNKIVEAISQIDPTQLNSKLQEILNILK